MKNVLIPTDFSDNSWNAIKYALQLLRKSNCTFYLFHVNPIVSYGSAETAVVAGRKDLISSMREESLKKLDDLILEIKRLYPNSNHTFETHTVHDFLVDAVRKELEERDIDLIIMGTKGARGLKKVTVGSNTGNVLTKIRCPLLSIPENAEYLNPKEIAFPTDYHLNYGIEVLEGLKQIVKLSNATLRVLYISKKGEQLSESQVRNKEFLTDYFKGLDYSFHNLTGKRLDTAVQCFVQSREIDMLAMVAKNLNFIQRVLFKPRVEEISYHTDIPFLILHE